MAEVKLRLNLDAEDVELVVDGQVALNTGSDVFKSWVEAYNDKHKPVEAPVEPKVVEVPTEPKVVENAPETSAEEVPAEPVDNENQE